MLFTCLRPLSWYRVVLCCCCFASIYGCWPRWPLPTQLFLMGTPSGRVFHFADDARTIKVMITTGKWDMQIYVRSEHCVKLPAHTTSCRCQDYDLFYSKRSEVLCGPSTGEFSTGGHSSRCMWCISDRLVQSWRISRAIGPHLHIPSKHAQEQLCVLKRWYPLWVETCSFFHGYRYCFWNKYNCVDCVILWHFGVLPRCFTKVEGSG